MCALTVYCTYADRALCGSVNGSPCELPLYRDNHTHYCLHGHGTCIIHMRCHAGTGTCMSIRGWGGGGGGGDSPIHSHVFNEE